MSVRAVVALALVLLVHAAPARAQEATSAEACAEGRERVEGYCCWPGQAFSTELHACDGPPRCPAGLVAHGAACIAPVVPDAPPAASAAPPPIDTTLAYAPAPAPSAAPVTLDAWPLTHEGTVVHRPVPRHGEDGGLVAAAMVVFDLGWALGQLVGMIEAAQPGCNVGPSSLFGSGPAANCNSWPLAFIPVGGGIASGMIAWPSTPPGTSGRRNTWVWGFALGIPSVLLQTGGLVMMAIALANEVHDIGIAPIVIEGVTVEVVPAAPAADVGVSVDAHW